MIYLHREDSGQSGLDYTGLSAIFGSESGVVGSKYNPYTHSPSQIKTLVRTSETSKISLQAS